MHVLPILTPDSSSLSLYRALCACLLVVQWLSAECLRADAVRLCHSDDHDKNASPSPRPRPVRRAACKVSVSTFVRPTSKRVQRGRAGEEHGRENGNLDSRWKGETTRMADTQQSSARIRRTIAATTGCLQ